MLINRLSLVMGLFFGLAGAQLPEYAQQYRQRLGGAIDELNRIIAQFQRDSASQGLTVDAAITRLSHNADPLAQQRATDMAETIARTKRLERQSQGFVANSAFTRLVVMVRDFDPDIARRAYTSFEPALPVTTEGFVAGAGGLALGSIFVHLMAWPFRRRGPYRKPGIPVYRKS